MGFIISGQATGPGVAYNIIQTPTSSSGTSTVTAMARDSSGNMFVVGNMNTDFANNAGDMFLAKYDSSNTLQWQKSLTWTLASTAYRIEQVNDIYIDSSNNIFITGSIRGLQYSYYGGNAFFAKLDSSGSFLMQKEITQQPQGGVANQWYYGGMGRKIITDSSGNIYLALGGRVIAGTVMKLNSSGVIQWQKNQQDTNTMPYLCHTMNGLVLDESNGVLYGLSSPEEFNNAGGAVITVSKFNSSTGASVWRTHFESSVNTYLPWGSDLVKGPSGDLYFAMACDHSNHNIYIGKLSASTGSVVWTKKFATSVSDYSTGIAVDSSENIYVSGYTIGSTTGAVLILKYDSSGSLLWQRNMYATPAASFDTAGKIYVESAGGFSVMLKINGKPMIAKLPADGTMTGTYSINGVSVLYGASSGTSSTGTLTVTQPGDYYRNSAMTIDNTTINIATSSLTTAGPTSIGSGAGSPIASGMTMGGTGSGMVISSLAAPTTAVEDLVVAGGGGGGAGAGGGGGAGGFRTATGFAVSTGTTYTVTVGVGGTGGGSYPAGGYASPTVGGNSVFSTITSVGGGYGGGQNEAGTTGGSGGGGGGGTNSAPCQNPGNGTASQGNTGAGGVQVSRGGGGGGAGATGSGFNGGVGLSSSISGTATYYSGGGGAGGYNGNGSGTGGIGGGGAGSSIGTVMPTAGTPNTGGGGGGAGWGPELFYTTGGGNGGSGIVIIRYADTFAAATSTTGSPDITVAGGYRVYKWTTVGSGSITF